MTDQQRYAAGTQLLEDLVEQARRGDRAALEQVVRAVSDDVYGLAVRMLWHPEDAEDACQEILIKIVTRLDGFRGEASFRTWVYRVAANHLLTTRKRRMERQAWTFPAFAEDLATGLDPAADDAEGDPEQAVLAEEVKIGCTQGMLQCLDRDHRLAYILGEVFGLPGDQAASVCGISPEAYRKRLSRARGRVRTFMTGHCGLVNPDSPCRCHRRVGVAVRQGRVRPDAPQFAGHPRRGARPPIAEVREMEELHATAAVFRSHPDYRTPERVTEAVTTLLERKRLRLLDTGEDR